DAEPAGSRGRGLVGASVAHAKALVNVVDEQNLGVAHFGIAAERLERRGERVGDRGIIGAVGGASRSRRHGRYDTRGAELRAPQCSVPCACAWHEHCLISHARMPPIPTFPPRKRGGKETLGVGRVAWM